MVSNLGAVNFFESISNGIENIILFFKNTFLLSGKLLGLLQRSLELPDILRNFVPSLIYTSIFMFVAISILKLILGRQH